MNLKLGLVFAKFMLPHGIFYYINLEIYMSFPYAVPHSNPKVGTSTTLPTNWTAHLPKPLQQNNVATDSVSHPAPHTLGTAIHHADAALAHHHDAATAPAISTVGVQPAVDTSTQPLVAAA